MNFIPKMNYETLINGYGHILDTIYAPKQYYERIMTFLREYRPRQKVKLSQFRFYYIEGLVRSIWTLGIREKGRRYYWRLFISTLFRRPKLFPLSMVLAIYGFHLRQVSENIGGIAIRDIPTAEQ